MNQRVLPDSLEEELIAHQLQLQKAAFVAEGPVPAAVRQDRLQRCVDLLKTHADRICEVISEDFGGRHPVSTLTMDVQTPIGHLKYAKKNVARWMRPQPSRCATRPRISPMSSPATAIPRAIIPICGPR